MKRTTLTLLMVLCVICGWAQAITCQIEGTTTDTNTTKLYLVESGAEIRTQSNVINIPVVDGKFSYTLKSDVLRYYELLVWKTIMHRNGFYHNSCFDAFLYVCILCFII